MKFFQRLFKRYQQDNITPGEKELVDRWYETSGNEPAPAWMDPDHIRHTKDITWQNINRNLRLRPPASAAKVRRMNPVVRYAAAAVVAGLGIWGAIQWMSSSRNNPIAYTVFSAGPGTRKHITLTDGTEIWLNNGSSLQLAAGTGSQREVWLTEGEAYFKVAKNAALPFTVHIDSLQARVLGTAFNIKAYRKLQKMQVAVTEGAVQVIYNSAVLDTLTRNVQLDFHPQTGEFAVMPSEMPVESGWWNGRFVLSKADFQELALRLKLKYSVTLLSRNPRILHASFSAGFPAGAPVENVLETFCTLYNTSYTLRKDTIIIK